MTGRSSRVIRRSTARLPLSASIRRSLRRGSKSPLPRKPRPARATPGSSATELSAHGRRVSHRFPDAEGTELDGENGAGRFRVLLHVEGQSGTSRTGPRRAWSPWPNGTKLRTPLAPTVAGLAWKIYPGTWIDLPDLTKEHAVFLGEGPNLSAEAQGFTRYATVWDGFIEIPADGGYTFHLIDRDGARLVIDGLEVAKTGPPFAQVCGSPGNALRYDRGSTRSRAPANTPFISKACTAISQGSPRLLWEGPALPLTDVPSAAFSHPRQDVVTR